MLRPWKISLSERIDASRGMPLYLQIVFALIHEIKSGRLSPGTFLPSSRQMADTLGVNRKTIVTAYEDLVDQGWLQSDTTRGTRVALSLPDQPFVQPGAGPPCAPEYRYNKVDGPPFVLSGGGMLTFDQGTPDVRLFPGDMLARAYREAIITAQRRNRLRYGDPRGSLILRQRLSDMLAAQRGLQAGVNNICLTRGSQMAVGLAARALLRPGDVVLMEALAYTPAAEAFRAVGARVVAVPLDADGIDVEALERACRDHPVRAVFLTPHHQFPTTVALRPERRLRLLELARQFAFAVIEDDYDHEYHFASQPLLPMASYAPDRVIYIGSLSKLTLPSLRLGYVVAPEPVIDAMAHVVMALDRQGNLLTEEAVADLMDSGELRRHIRKTQGVYDTRRRAFANALKAEFGDTLRYQAPDGGLAFWLTSPDTAMLDRIDTGATAAGVRLAPSDSYSLSRPGERGLRLGFASLDETEAADGLRRIRAASGVTRASSQTAPARDYEEVEGRALRI